MNLKIFTTGFANEVEFHEADKIGTYHSPIISRSPCCDIKGRIQIDVIEQTPWILRNTKSHAVNFITFQRTVPFQYT